MPCDLSIIIVNYQTHQLTRNTIESVVSKKHPFSYEIYVVDNASTDESLKQLQDDFSHQEQVNFIANPENLGFSHANNRALEEISSEYVLLLNSDTAVQVDCLEKCMEKLRNEPEVAAVGCRIILPDGSLDKACKRSFPDVTVSFYRMTGLSALFPRSRRFGRYNLTYLDEKGTYEVDSLSGAFMMVRKRAVDEVGLLDEDFFMYGEDIDWCYRFKERGWKIIYRGDVRITHYKGGSGRESKALYEFYNAMRLFYDKHYRDNQSAMVTAFIYLGIWGIYGWKKLVHLVKG